MSQARRVTIQQGGTIAELQKRIAELEIEKEKWKAKYISIIQSGNMSELKPCPFCGKEPIEPFYYDGTMRTGCNNANWGTGKYGTREREYICDLSMLNPMSVDEWNTLPIEDALQKRIDELEIEKEKWKAKYISKIQEWKP